MHKENEIGSVHYTVFYILVKKTSRRLLLMFTSATCELHTHFLYHFIKKKTITSYAYFNVELKKKYTYPIGKQVSTNIL